MYIQYKTRQLAIAGSGTHWKVFNCYEDPKNHRLIIAEQQFHGSKVQCKAFVDGFLNAQAREGIKEK